MPVPTSLGPSGTRPSFQSHHQSWMQNNFWNCPQDFQPSLPTLVQQTSNSNSPIHNQALKQQWSGMKSQVLGMEQKLWTRMRAGRGGAILPTHRSLGVKSGLWWCLVCGSAGWITAATWRHVAWSAYFQCLEASEWWKGPRLPYSFSMSRVLQMSP